MSLPRVAAPGTQEGAHNLVIMGSGTPEKRSTSISYPMGSKMYQTIGEGSFDSGIGSLQTPDMFYRESTEKKLRLRLMERNPSHKFQARLVERHTGNERDLMERRV